MKILVSALVLSITFISVQAQSARKAVFWSGDRSCGFRSPVNESDEIACSMIQTDRGPVSIISHNGMRLLAAFAEDDDFLIVAAQISNTTGEAIEIDTDLWGASHFRTKASFYAHEKPILAETAIPSRDIVRNMATREQLGTSLETFIAENAKTTTETRNVRRPDGTRVRVTQIVPDKEAQQAAVRQGETRKDLMTNEQRRIRNSALTAKVVSAGESVKGLVYFRRVKKAEYILFSLSVGDTTYFFQLPRPRS